MKVVLVWGGWTCMAGYVRWAYVSEALEGCPVNTVTPGCEKIGRNLYKPANRTEVSDPKNCDYGKEPAPYPIRLCRKWIEEHGHELVAEVKMSTD